MLAVLSDQTRLYEIFSLMENVSLKYINSFVHKHYSHEAKKNAVKVNLGRVCMLKK